MKKSVFFAVWLLSAMILLPGSLIAETIRVDSVIVTAKSMKAAEKAGKQAALKRALDMLGNREIPAPLRKMILDQADTLVTIRRRLNTKKKKGAYTPVFFCDVDNTAIGDIIERYRKSTFTTLKRPQMNIAVVFRSLPERFQSQKAFFLDRINNLLEEHFGGGGFRISTPPSVMISRLDRKNPQEVFTAFVRHSTEVNYLLFGAIDLLDDGLSPHDQGRYYKGRVGLTLRFFSVFSHDQLSFSRDVYGMGENENACIINAMTNSAKAITEKIGTHRIIKDWDRKLEEGFEYSLIFCSQRGTRWEKILRRALKKKGTFVSKSRGDNVTEIYRFHANPGEFVFPSMDFEDFLLDLDGFDQVDADVLLIKDRLFFVFGDAPACFELGFDAFEQTGAVVEER